MDLHTHSDYSKHPSEWFLQRIGAQESYTDIEEVYRIAKARGMDFVTITDHNSIEGATLLHDRHPDDTFISVEITTYFPENGCKVHVLAYDISQDDFEAIEKTRHSIYELRDELKRRDVACSVAHATYAINKKLNVDLLEKLILLFDVFESVNGSRSQVYNQMWTNILHHLTPEQIHSLHAKHGIEPWSDTSWVKGFTGGSDDHSGLLIGESYTLSKAKTIPEMISEIKHRQTSAEGRHGDHKTLAFAIYKIAYEFSKSRAGTEGSGFLDFINSLMFDNKKMGLKHWLTLQKMKMKKETGDKIITRFLDDLVNARSRGDISSDELFDQLYQSLSNLADGFFSMIMDSIERGLKHGEPGQLLRSFSAALPPVFLTAPFFSAIFHLHQGRKLLQELARNFGESDEKQEKKTLWFTDTITDLNGVSETMKNLAWCAFKNNRPLKMVTCLPEDEFTQAQLPPNVINLPCIYSTTPDFYNSFTLRIPSVMKSMDIIASENPDEIVISTPGPVGALGSLIGRIQNIKRVGVYHTDFSKQAELYIGDEWVSNVIEGYTLWFYKHLEEIRVPTLKYVDILKEKGLDPDKMKLFARNIEPNFVQNDPNHQEMLRSNYDLNDKVTLLYAGRIGKEKNIHFIFDIYDQLKLQHDNVKLMLIGDGPEKDRLCELYRSDPNVIFTGRVPREQLCHYYLVADLFLFPSTTDTFGMVVLEAQACGLPAIVTDVGGPQEIVKDGQTGNILPAGLKSRWVETVNDVISDILSNPDLYRKRRDQIRSRFKGRIGWEGVLDEMMGTRNKRQTPVATMERVDAP